MVVGSNGLLAQGMNEITGLFRHLSVSGKDLPSAVDAIFTESAGSHALNPG
jgi:hypothetical protein